MLDKYFGTVPSVRGGMEFDLGFREGLGGFG